MEACVFPGQGSQYPEMLEPLFAALPAGRRILERAEAASGLPLKEIIRGGEAAGLYRTAVAQTAILAVDLAWLEALRHRQGIEPIAFAGHSAGEMAAHVAAGALDLEAACELARRRGELQQRAVPPEEAAMAAVLAVDEETVEAVTADISALGPDHFVAVANHNGPGQNVLAGRPAGVEAATDILWEEHGAIVHPLKLSIPGHCRLMDSVMPAWAEQVAAVPVRDPVVPLFTCLDGSPLTSAEAVRDALRRLMNEPVRWTSVVETLVDRVGVQRIWEVGPGEVLRKIGARMRRGVRWRHVEGAMGASGNGSGKKQPARAAGGAR